MSARVLDVSEDLGKEIKLTQQEEAQIASLFGALDNMIAHVKNMQAELKVSGKAAKKIVRQEKDKEQLSEGEGNKVKRSLGLLREGHIGRFAKKISRTVDLTGEKRELNEKEIKELHQIYFSLLDFRNGIKGLEMFAGVALRKIEVLSRLFNVYERVVISEEDAQRRL
jgi:hypothetical protein